MSRVLWTAALLALLPAAPAAAQALCSGIVDAACLASLGAGAVAAADAGCTAKWERYRDCLAEAAAGGASAAPTDAASCPTSTAEALWASAERDDDCRAYRAYAAACPATPQATFAASRMERLGCDAPARPAAGAIPPETSTPIPTDAKGFRDCDVCPEMLAVPGGAVLLGSTDAEPGRTEAEGPLRAAAIAPFALGRFEVTHAEWEACHAEGACAFYTLTDHGWGRGRRPAVDVSWNDARAYLAWLSAKTGRAYRLPSEAEWEHAARARARSAYPWGEEWSAERARGASDRTAEVGSYPPNAFGLHDMAGNVYEWAADCWNPRLDALPADGSAATTGDCATRPLRGGAFDDATDNHRSAFRVGYPADTRFQIVGFRVARDLP